MSEVDFREATAHELAVINRLVDAASSFAEILRSQMQGLRVRQLDDMGSLQLEPDSVPLLGNERRVVAEASFRTLDGHDVDLLLHVRAGRLSELEVVADDPSVTVELPEPSSITAYARRS